jgi:hypothetical protein
VATARCHRMDAASQTPCRKRRTAPTGLHPAACAVAAARTATPPAEAADLPAAHGGTALAADAL